MRGSPSTRDGQRRCSSAGDARQPVVVDRRRVTLCPEALPRQVYHAAQDLPPAKAALLVREVHEAVDALTD